MSYNTYQNLPSWGPETPGPQGPLSAPPPEVPKGPHSVENPQVGFHLNVIKDKRQGLIDKEKMFKKKYKKYNKILNRLM